MNTIALQQKIAAIDADLISVAHAGSAAIHAQMFQKLAEIITDPDDIDAVVAGLQELQEDCKIASAGPQGSPAPTSASSSGLEKAIRAAAIGSMVAPPVLMGIKYLHGKMRHQEALRNIQTLRPDLFQQDPVRAHAIFEMLHDTAPSLAHNTPIAADLVGQMMAAPQIDLGTASRMTEMGKNIAQSRGKEGPLDRIQHGFSSAGDYGRGIQTAVTGKVSEAKVAARHLTTDRVLTFFDWSSEICKTAGITDAFTGNGDTMTQAGNAFNASMLDAGNTMLPLDTIVRELINKEVELAQREQNIAQQEQQLQQAQQMLAQMAQIYQQQTGVDTQTGQPMAAGGEATPAGDEAAPSAGDEPTPSATMDTSGAPSASMGGEEASNASTPEADPSSAAPAGDDTGADTGSGDVGADGAADGAPDAAGADAAGEAADGQDADGAAAGGDAGGAEEGASDDTQAAAPEGQAGADEGAVAAPPTPEDAQALTGPVVTPEAAEGAQEEMAQQAEPAAPADEQAGGDAPSAEEMAAANPAAEGAPEGGEAPAEGGEQPAEGEAPAEGGEAPAEDAPAEGGDAPAEGEETGAEEDAGEGSDTGEEPAEGEPAEGGDSAESGESDAASVPGADGPVGGEAPEGAVGDSSDGDSAGAPEGVPAAGDDHAVGGDGAAEPTPEPGTATPDNIEGTPADAAHDNVPGAPAEGSPEDQALDSAAADAVNNGAQPPTSVGDIAQPTAPSTADAANVAAGNEQGSQTIERLFTVPIRVSVKVGEADSTAVADAHRDAKSAFDDAMDGLLV
jgi:hypothetical protein